MESDMKDSNFYYLQPCCIKVGKECIFIKRNFLNNHNLQQQKDFFLI